MKKILASLGVAAAIFGGAVGCGTNTGGYGNSGYVDEVQYGYYDQGYHDAAHYHPYSHPHQVHIPRSQYNKYRYEYQPHGTQHTVTIHKSTTTTTHHYKGGRTVTRHTTTRRSTTTTRRSGGFGYRKR